MPPKTKGSPEPGSTSHDLCGMVADILEIPDYDSLLLAFHIERISGNRPSVRTIRRWKHFKTAPKSKGYPEAVREIWSTHYED